MSIKLFMVLLGATVPGRLIEQHDVVFAAAQHMRDLLPVLQDAWPAGAKVHVDAYREVNVVGQYRIALEPDAGEKTHPDDTDAALKLFFFNLGGYVLGDMEEHHHKALLVASQQKDAITAIKQSEFYQHCGYAGAESHIDDKMTVDIDDVHGVNDLFKQQGWRLRITPLTEAVAEDVWQVGYLALSKLAQA